MKKLTSKLIAILLAVMCTILSVTAAAAATTRRPVIQEMSVTLNGHTADRYANFTSSERVPVVICAKTKGTDSSELTWRWTNYNNNAEIVQLDNKHLMAQLSKHGCVTGVIFTKNGKHRNIHKYRHSRMAAVKSRGRAWYKLGL